MKIVEYFLKNRSITILLLSLVFFGGIFAYLKMGKLEDAPFTIKQALVVTQYPGASPEEVQTQVTDVLEESIQSMGELYYLKTENRAGISKITVFVKKEIRAADMQQLWDKLRRKVNDVQPRLPDGAKTSVVMDDFGDVLGVFYGLSGAGHTPRELESQAKDIKNDLLKVKDVAKVELYGVPTPSIEIVFSESLMAMSGITTHDIAQVFAAQNRVVDAGSINIDEKRVRIESTGNFYSLDEIRNLTIVSKNNDYVRLSDIAEVREGYITPATNKMKINGQEAVGIAISTTDGGNVVDMAELVSQRVEFFNNTMPEGFELMSIYDQGYESAVANDNFILNLIISVVMVVAILLFFIGFKNGLLVGSGLVFSIFATLIVMMINGIALQRMSLAAIIIAMGMLVDNAIVVFDSALVRMQFGTRKRPAIIQSASSTALPLLAATIIAILTFMPIYFSPHVTGEFMSSLVIVIGVSLMFSWLFALTQTTFFIQEFVRRPRKDGIKSAPYNGNLYQKLRRALQGIIKHKSIVVGITILLLVISAYCFRFIPTVFIPTLDKQYFTVDMWMPEGTHIDHMDDYVQDIVEHISTYEETETVSSFVGQSPPRYYLANSSFGPQSNYANLLVKGHTSKGSRALRAMLVDSMRIKYPEAFIKVNKFELTSSPEALIEARFLGPDVAVLDSLTNVALKIMYDNPKTANARNQWGNMTMLVKPVYDPLKAGVVGTSKSTMMESIKSLSDGLPVGVYRDNEKKVPVLIKTDNTVSTPDDLQNISVWNGVNSEPLAQLTKDIETTWEYPRINTYNRQLTMAAMCDVIPEATMFEVHAEIRDAIEAIELPEGYSFFWDSQFKDQGEAIDALTKYFPVAFLLLIVILVALFGNFKQPIIIIAVLPLSLIGVVIGLLITGFNFGFFPIAGWLGLLGMIIKNVIVLIDEINAQLKRGLTSKNAIIEATVSRARPVLMAATTTVFGMIPLLFDVAFGGMAATIIFGLTFATILTLFVTPAIYAVIYRVKSHD